MVSSRRLAIAVLVLLVVGIAVMVLRGLAMTPAEVSAWREQHGTVDWSTVRDDPATRLHLRILVASEGQPGSFVQRTIEERMNVEIEPVFLGAAAYSYAKPLMLAGGDIPDVIVEYDPITLQQDARHGFLLPIPYSVILEHAPTYVRIINDNDPIGWLYSNYEGANYGIPNYFAELRYAVPGIWRADWLRRVGIERLPETLDEFHDAFHRFTFGDPDGNGVQDTWGLSGDINNWWWASFADVFGAFGVMPFDWNERDGHAVWGGVLPETRQALEVLHDWAAEGILHPDFVTDKSRETLDRKFYNGVTGYLYYMGKYANLNADEPGSLATKVQTLSPEAEVVCGWLPMGPDGQRGSRVWGGGHSIAFGRPVADRPEVVIRYLRLLEEVVTDEQFYLATHLGRRGVHWDYRDPEVGPASGIVRVGEYTDSNKAKRALLGSLEGGVLTPVCGDAEMLDRYAPAAELAFNRRYRDPRWARRDILGKPDAVGSAGELLGDLRNYQMTTFAEIIRGDRPLADFEVFVEAWYARGGECLTAEANALLAEKKRIYRQVGASE